MTIDACPECEHERAEPYRSWIDAVEDWLRWRLKKPSRKVPPAVCEWTVAYGADPCFCPDPFHGS